MKSSFGPIESLMHEHRVSKTELAKIAGVGPSAVTRWSLGGAIRDHHLAAIAKHFNVSLASLAPRAESELRVREHPPHYDSAPTGTMQPTCRIPASCDLPHELADMKAQLSTLTGQVQSLTGQVQTLTTLLGAALKHAKDG